MDGDILKWKVYDINKLGYFRIVKKIRTMGYGNKQKTYWSPSGSSLENRLKFMYNDDFIVDMLVVNKVFDVVKMELYLKTHLEQQCT